MARFVALTAVISFVGPHDAKLLLAKDSFVTGLFGLLCLATLAAPRPLMFYFGRKFATVNYGMLYTAKGTASLLVPIGAWIVATTGSWNVVLVVADDEETRDGIEQLLSSDGYHIEPARNETDAIERASRCCPDLILVSLSGSPADVVARLSG